jgi:hypothetical protein
MNKALTEYIEKHGMRKQPSTLQKLFTRLIRSKIDNITVTNKKQKKNA